MGIVREAKAGDTLGWVVSTNEEEFHDGPWPTKEEALAAAVSELDLEPGTDFFVGRAVEPTVHLGISAEDAMEFANSAAGEDHGEWVDGWPDATGVIAQDLEDRLEQAFQDWLKDNPEVQPTWWEIVDIEHVTVPKVA